MPSSEHKPSRYSKGNGASIGDQSNLPAIINEMGGKIPPHSMDAEIAVLGSMLLDRAAIPKVIEILKAEAFYKDAHKTIFVAIMELFNRAISVDITTLNEELRRLGSLESIGGTYYIIELTS